MKVLHCPEIIGGNAQQLARAERELGLDSKSIAFRQNYFLYEADEVLLSKSAGRLRLEIARWRLFFQALSYDVIHYNFGQSIMPVAVHYKDERLSHYPILIRWFYHVYSHMLELLDVRLLKLLGKVIVITYQGDDARQGDFCRKNFPITFSTEVNESYYSSITDQMKRRRIAKFSKLADLIYALNPDLLHVLPATARFCPYSHIDLNKWTVVKSTIGKPMRPIVLHAPSHKGVKGTRFVLEAVERLKNKGISFEFVLVEAMSNAEARKQYERADILIDQLLAGWYGGLAVEAMALGKTVLVYIRENDLRFIPAEMQQDFPFVQVTPDSIEEVLRRMLEMPPEELLQLGHRSRAFVERWHDPIKIAERLKRDYEDVIRRRGRIN